MADERKPESERSERTRREIKNLLRAAGRPMTRSEIEAGLVLMRNDRLCGRWLSRLPPAKFEGYTLTGVGPALARMADAGEITVQTDDLSSPRQARTVSLSNGASRPSDGISWISLTEAAVIIAGDVTADGLKAVDAHLALAKVKAADCLKWTPRLGSVVMGRRNG